MYRPKPKPVVILEETFLLLKPDVAEHHGAIIDELRNSGFLVVSRQMPSTRSMIEDIVDHFTDVATLRRDAERVEQFNGASFTNRLGVTVTAGGPAPAATGRRDSLGGASAAVSGSPQRPYVQIPSFVSHATYTTSRRSSNAASLPTRPGFGPHDGGAGAADSNSPLSYSGKTNNLGGAFSSGSDWAQPAWESVKREHVSYLLRGTCIAMAVSASNAIERIARWVGPEDAEVARASAPTSLRGRYATSALHNAAFCALSFRSASELIFKVFGYEPQVRTEALQEGGGAAETTTATTMASHHGGGAGTDHHQQLLYQPGCHLASVEFLPTTSTAASSHGAAGDQHAVLADIADISTPEQVAHARDRLRAERAAVNRDLEVLRQREVDLLLREEKFAAQIEEMRRGGGGVAGLSGSMAFANSTAALTTTTGADVTAAHRSPAPPPRTGKTSFLRGAPVSSRDAERVGTAAPPGAAGRSLDHRLAVRPKARSRAALHASHLRDVIPAKAAAVATLEDERRDVRRAIEKASSADYRSAADTLVSVLWTAVRERDNEARRLARVAEPAHQQQQQQAPGSPNSLSPRASFRRINTARGGDATTPGRMSRVQSTAASPRSDTLEAPRGGAAAAAIGGSGTPFLESIPSAGNMRGSPHRTLSPGNRDLVPSVTTPAPAAGPSPAVLAEVNSVVVAVFTGMFRELAQKDIAAWTQRSDTLSEKIDKAQEEVDKLKVELKKNEEQPQFVDVDGVEALSELTYSDLMTLVGNTETVTTLFFRFDGAREREVIAKADFIRFYENCAAFRDMDMVNDARRVRDMVQSRCPGKSTLTLNDFNEVLMWLLRQ